MLKIKKYLAVPLILILSILAGYLSLTFVYNLPIGIIQDNVEECVDYFEESYPETMSAYTASGMDLVTDATMLLIACDQTKTSPFFDSLNNSYSGNMETDSASYMYNTYFNKYSENNEKIEYSRYWHGYLIFLKPLLCIFNYGQIRSINMIIQILFFAVVCYLLNKKNLSYLIVPFAVFWLFLNPVATILCLQYTSITLIVFVEIIVILLMKKQNSFVNMFCLFGIATSFFDFLTFPPVTYGIPVILLLILNNKTLIQNVKLVLSTGISWCFGYLGMWFGKWVIASAVLKKNVIADGIENIISRTGDTNLTNFSFFSTLIKQFSGMNLLLIPFIILIAVVLLFFIIKNKIRIIDAPLLVVLLFIILIPFMWFAIVKNHSFIHAGFTFRNLSITVFGILSYLSYMLSKNQNKLMKG